MRGWPGSDGESPPSPRWPWTRVRLEEGAVFTQKPVCRTKPVGPPCRTVLGNPLDGAMWPAWWLARAAPHHSRLPPRVPGDWGGREAGEEETSGKQPRWSGAGPPHTACPGRACAPASERRKARGLVANSILAAPQGVLGRLEFLSSVNYVLQIKIAARRTEDIKNSSTYSASPRSSVGKSPSARQLTPRASRELGASPAHAESMGGSLAVGVLQRMEGHAAPPALAPGDKEGTPLRSTLLWLLPHRTGSVLVIAPPTPLSVTSSPKTAFSQPALHEKQAFGPLFTLRRDVLTYKSLHVCICEDIT